MVKSYRTGAKAPAPNVATLRAATVGLPRRTYIWLVPSVHLPAHQLSYVHRAPTPRTDNTAANPTVAVLGGRSEKKGRKVRPAACSS